ncbi:MULTISPECIES: hypothetical protein [unclassified Novosphingobium]|uniref:hypothetical protein n=1 Tax=unclassified Novosphingobium TaxID=2644732 RepID=UPI000F7E119D|nr:MULTISPECIES: hypothetical protein [unclassified Novosphingobium]
MHHQQQKAEAFLNRVLHGVELIKPPLLGRRKLHALLGVNECRADLRLCDVSARKKSAEILFDVVGGLRARFDSSGVQFRHITFIDDIGITSDRYPLLRFCALKRKVDKAIRTLGLSALVFIEIQPLLNYPALGEGRTLMLHAHALCWGSTSRRAYRSAKRALNQSRSWQNKFGAEPVKDRHLRKFDDVLRIACYVAKLPHDGKIRVPVGEDKWRFRPTLQGYPNRLALRIAEGLSHYSIFDAVFSVGEGRFYRLDWKRQLVDWHQKRLLRYGKGRRFDLADFWQRRHRSGRFGYDKPFSVD